jgi:LTXXQ motif family protein
MKSFHLLLNTLIMLAALLVAAPSFAQQENSRPVAPSANTVLIPGAMRGLGTGGPTGYMRLCSPLSVGLYEWRVRWVERFVKPTAEQRPALDELSAASAKAMETIAAACQKEPVGTTTLQVAIMEKRVAAMLEALKIVRPAYENFYASLDARQKDFLNALGPGRHGWRW